MLIVRSTNRFFNHSATVHAFSKVTSLDSMLEWVKHACLEDFQDIAPPPKINI